MRHIYLLLVVLTTSQSQAQETVFKDNLFNHALFSVEVKHDQDGTTLNFEKNGESDSLILYTWKYEAVLKTFHHQFDSVKNDEESKVFLFTKDEIVQEAGRVFFAVEAKMKLATENATGPIAGTFGFVNKEVFIRKDFEYRDSYLLSLKEARRVFRKGDTTSYENFRIGTGRRVVDTIFDKTKDFTPHYLKKNGPKTFAQAQIDNIYRVRNYLSQNGRADLQNVEKWFYYRKVLNEERYSEYLPGKLKLLNEGIESDSVQLVETAMNLKKIDEELADEKYKQLRMGFGSKEYQLIKKKNPKLEEQFTILSYDRSMNASSKLYLTNSLDEKRNKRELLELMIEVKDGLMDSLEYVERRLDRFNDEYNLKDTVSMKSLLKKLSDQNAALQELRSKFGAVLVELSIDSVSIKVDKTFIESMIVYGNIMPTNADMKEGRFRNTAVMFYNNEPIGISTLTSIDHSLSSANLFAIIDNHYYELDVRDVIAFYNPILMNGRSDLSPADTTFTVVKNEGEQVVSLHKTATQKLFEMKVYSDFVGLSGTTPNGLVQLEFSKEMYLSSQKYTRVFRKGLYLNQSLGTYISPFFTLSKLEKTNKFLPLTVGDSNRAARTLELKRFEMFSVGADMNLYSIAVPRWKTQLFIDPGIAFARIGLVDSSFTSDSTFTVNQSAVNSFAARLTAKVVFQTDERYFFDMRASMQWYKLLTNDVLQIKETIGEDLSKPAAIMSKVLFNVGLNAGFSPTSNTNGKLFIRYNYYGLAMKKVLQGFSQIQVGYSYYLNN